MTLREKTEKPGTVQSSLMCTSQIVLVSSLLKEEYHAKEYHGAVILLSRTLVMVLCLKATHCAEENFSASSPLK